MLVYEEYESAAEKRRAQRGAKRGVATGKARGYVLVFNEDGIQHGRYYTYNAIGEVRGDSQPGEPPHAIAFVDPSVDFIRNNCRHIGFASVPEDWKRAFARCLRPAAAQHDDVRLRYRKLLRYA